MVIAAPVVATFGLVLLYGVLQPTHRGPAATFWNRGRAAVLPGLDRLATRLGVGYAAYELKPREYAGRIDAPVEDVDRLLAAHGFERMPLSAWKTLPDGRSEAGSWARRDGVLADRQLHVMLFRTEDGATDVYAHDEFNAFHPRYAAEHYHGIDYRPQTGCQQLQELIGEYLHHPQTEPPGGADRLDDDTEPPGFA
ncbi:MAG: hypothetical protein U9O06_13700 [Euryarchaeota archaeon]|nr:hypothetical protein [Euryarchaeota archaeon]